MPCLFQTLCTNFPQQVDYLQTTTSACIPWYIYWIPRKLSRLATLLSWTSPAHCNHSQCLFWGRLQLSPRLWLKTLCQRHPHLISLRPKWTPNFWQFWTLNRPPNWICSQPWPLTIHLHWRTQRPWATHPRKGQCNFTHWTPTIWWQYPPWTHTTNTSDDQPDPAPKETHSTTKANNLILPRMYWVSTICWPNSHCHANHQCHRLVLQQQNGRQISPLTAILQSSSKILMMTSATPGYMLSKWKSRT